MIPEVVTIDFETERIEPRPKYPPEPVGVSIKLPGKRSHYFAWRHPCENNCDRADGRAILERIWETDVPLLFHNAAFDLAIAYERLGLPILPWRRVHDTQFLLFLFDPHARELSLKPAAEKIIGWAPEERDELDEWIWEHRKELEAEYGVKVKKSELGAWIAKAPGALVGRYAEGDTDRTHALFAHLYPIIRSNGMLEAYDRERRLQPILMENERIGLRTDRAALERDIPLYTSALERVETGMRHYLNAPDLSFDNDRDLAAAFVRCNVVKEDRWVLTAKSKQLSVAKDNLPPDAFVDPIFASAFGYRNRLTTCLKMFMVPWFEKSQHNNGYVHTKWNQVRNPRGGTRTGRPSMTDPNMLNVSKLWEGRGDGYVHPERLNLPELPLVRKYILPDEWHLFVHRDFDGQELRIFAHFESGALLQQYLENPELDPHSWVRDEIAKMTGRIMERTDVKAMNFQSMYGGGVTAISEALRCSMAEAKQFKNFHDTALPGRKILNEEIIRLVRRGEPIKTWGGRLYYVEPPSRVNGRMQTWEYKLINYEIQGSAADITKEAICRWHEGGGTSNGTRFLLTIYDELDVSSPLGVWRESMEWLQEVMDGMELDCPMRSSGKIGESWGTLEKM